MWLDYSTFDLPTRGGAVRVGLVVGWYSPALHPKSPRFRSTAYTGVGAFFWHHRLSGGTNLVQNCSLESPCYAETSRYQIPSVSAD